MSATTPYRVPRLVSLFLSFSFGVIGFAIGLNALVKSNSDKDNLRKSVPAGATVDINDNDVYKSGVVVTAMSGLIALASLFAFPSALLSHHPSLSHHPFSLFPLIIPPLASLPSLCR